MTAHDVQAEIDKRTAAADAATQRINAALKDLPKIHDIHSFGYVEAEPTCVTVWLTAEDGRLIGFAFRPGEPIFVGVHDLGEPPPSERAAVAGDEEVRA